MENKEGKSINERVLGIKRGGEKGYHTKSRWELVGARSGWNTGIGKRPEWVGFPV